MAVKLGNGNWAVKEDKLLAYNDNSGRFFNKEFDFARGSIATYVAKDGLIKSAASDVPRIDFSDSTNGALLLEPQSTNLFTYSNEFRLWGELSNASVITNALVSPDGTLNADEFVFDGTNNGRIEKTVPTTNGLVYTFSIYLKNKDIANPTQVFIGNEGGTQGEFVTITNEWQRFTTTQTANGTSEYPRVNYNGIGSLYAYGAQFEQLPYATSYIPTSGSATTRLADVCNNSGSAQDFNSEQGVLYCEIAALADDGTTRRFSISDGTNNNRVVIGYSSSNRFQFVISDGGSVVLNQLKTVSDITQFNKIALFYKLNDCAIWINGQKVGVDTIATMPSGLNTINFNQGSSSENLFGSVRDLQVFTTALTDEQLAALTTI